VKQKKKTIILAIVLVLYTCPSYSNAEHKKQKLTKHFQELIQKNQIDKVLTNCDELLKLDPQNKEMYFTILAALFNSKHDIDQKISFAAIDYCKKTLELDPRDYRGYFFWAIALTHLDKKRQAVKTYVKALRLNRNSSASWYNAALLLRHMQMPEEALSFYQEALKLDPNKEGYHFGIAQTYLVLGDFVNGWNHMDLGRMSFLQNSKKRITRPEEIKGKTVLIPKSWGLGDMIQFVRYAKLIKAHGGNVLMHVHHAAAKIISTCKYVDKVTVERPKEDEYDGQIALWSLPGLFGSTQDSIPGKTPYLHADPTLSYYWSTRLAHDKNFKIGICWAGSGAFKEIKDIPLKKFAPLAHIPGVTLYSLQKGRGCEQLKEVDFDIVDLSNEIDNEHGPFMDTAAIMKNVDLIITVDTSLAHLAGALNVPVWTYIIFAPDWRWMLERTDTPWYQTMKLFRGQKPYDWEYVIHTMKTELERMLN